jgi:hypothetical protein
MSRYTPVLRQVKSSQGAMGISAPVSCQAPHLQSPAGPGLCRNDAAHWVATATMACPSPAHSTPAVRHPRHFCPPCKATPTTNTANTALQKARHKDALSTEALHPCRSCHTVARVMIRFKSMQMQNAAAALTKEAAHVDLLHARNDFRPGLLCPRCKGHRTNQPQMGRLWAAGSLGTRL